MSNPHPLPTWPARSAGTARLNSCSSARLETISALSPKEMTLSARRQDSNGSPAGVTGQHRSTQRRPAGAQQATDRDAPLRAGLRDWARNHPRQGFRRAYHDARRRLEGNARIWLPLLPLARGKARPRNWHVSSRRWRGGREMLPCTASSFVAASAASAVALVGISPVPDVLVTRQTGRMLDSARIHSHRPTVIVGLSTDRSMSR